MYIYTVLIVYIYSLHNCGKRALYHQCADKQALWIWIYHMMDYPIDHDINWNTILVGGFNPSEHILVNGKDYSIYEMDNKT